MNILCVFFKHFYISYKISEVHKKITHNFSETILLTQYIEQAKSWTVGRTMAVRFPEGKKFFSSPQCSSSYTMSIQALSRGLKRPESKADQLPPSSADVKNALSPHIFGAWYLKTRRHTFLLHITLNTF
jgi:hypothetical protein